MSLEEELTELELQTLNQTVRADPSKIGALLHEDFFEFGVSGRKWSKAELMNTLPAEAAIDEVEIHNFSLRHLGRDHVLLGYKLIVRRARRTSTSLRSSIWERSGDTWLMVFHQGTRV